MARGGPDYAAIGVRGIIGRFFRRLEVALERGYALRIGLVIDSDQETETYKLLGMIPQLREWQGGRLVKALRVDGFTVTNKVYEATLNASVDDLRRDKTQQLGIRFGSMGTKAGTHWAHLLTALIIANGTCYDGKAFFATNHELGSSGSQSNLLTATEIPALNVSDITNPTADEWQDIIGGLTGHMYSFKDDQDEPINGEAMEFTLMVPPKAMANAKAAVRGQLRNSGSTAPLASQDFTINVVGNGRLTAASEIYLFREDSEMKPFILQGEVEPTVKVIGPDSEHAFKNDEVLFGVKTVRAAAYGEPLHAIKATLS